MRLCIVSEFFYPDMTGGTGMLLSDLARSMHDEFGVEVDVITTRHLYRAAGAKLPRFEDWNGIRISRVSAPNFNRHSTFRRLIGNAAFSLSAFARLVGGRRYDLILTATAPPTIPQAAQTYRKLTGTPYVYIIYDLEPDRVVQMEVMGANSLPVRLLRRFQKGWLADASKVIVIGRCMEDYLHRHYGMKRDRVEVIPVGADPERISPRSRETALRQKFGLSGFVVLYAGNFGKYHNFNTILDAAQRLRVSHPEIMFALFGNGSQDVPIRARIAAEGIDNVRVFPILPQSEVPELLASADVSLVTLEPNMEGLCVPSKFYPILASGRPTIALVGEQSEIARVIAEADCGIRLDQGDTDRLVQALTHLAGHPEEAARMGQNARVALVENYSINHLARRYHAAFLETVQKNRQPGFWNQPIRMPSAHGIQKPKQEASSEKV